MNGPTLAQGEQFHRARRLEMQGDFKGAAEIYLRLLKKQPNDPNLNYVMGGVLANLRRFEPALRYARRAVRIRPNVGEYHSLLGYIHLTEGRFDKAEVSYDKALSLKPGYSPALAGKAEIVQMNGQYERAYELLDPGETGQIEHAELAIAFSKAAPRVGKHGRALDVLEKHLANPDLPVIQRVEMFSRKGRILDELGEYDKAFEAFKQANDATPIQYDPQREARMADGIMANWTRKTMASMLRRSQRSDLPVFILGMPRSGTSLVEQIIASHSQAHGAGEIPNLYELCKKVDCKDPVDTTFFQRTDPAAMRLADRRVREYLHGLSKLCPGAKRVSDKTPNSYVRFGLIDLLLPGAKVIHCVRHPLDTAVSCYFQNFTGNLPFSYNLGHIASYYNIYRRLMAHWCRELDIPVLDIVYERITADPEPHIRRIIEFVGLDFEDSCLSFHKTRRVTLTASNEQVRKPMYRSSVHRYKHYEKHIGPLLDGIDPAYLEYKEEHG